VASEGVIADDAEDDGGPTGADERGRERTSSVRQRVGDVERDASGFAFAGGKGEKGGGESGGGAGERSGARGGGTGETRKGIGCEI
jgi:hypothetical protein